MQRARRSLQGGEGCADTTGFESRDRRLAGSHALGEIALTQLGCLARVADLFANATLFQLLDRGAGDQSSSAV
ncbi:MAG: hypothetical protein M3Q30_22115 [Actinomycetota bacterium]|nr:hypothetical protein [Actinomycetota bacterium]